ncbi:hypothetical protein GVY41_17080 [Frigidibacter albus]|uniref:Uncharacterized protein n=1 Tax=Frigidibacter albus TaxID=1465486 RepID=A0A6L8VJT3_9RHOB|nr:hypothetical protein [Frigidibacter albus]MZQ90627.1 hypothetical protein [Frigidibacter albus]NBE32717.1 hypothetical protein [Frigidibacter albus]
MSPLPEANGQPPEKTPPIGQPLSRAEKRRTLLHWLLTTAVMSGLILVGTLLSS